MYAEARHGGGLRSEDIGRLQTKVAARAEPLRAAGMAVAYGFGAVESACARRSNCVPLSRRTFLLEEVISEPCVVFEA